MTKTSQNLYHAALATALAAALAAAAVVVVRGTGRTPTPPLAPTPTSAPTSVPTPPAIADATASTATTEVAVDARALALLKQMAASYKSLRSYSSGVKTTDISSGRANTTSSGAIAWSKPNRFAIALAEGPSRSQVTSNGRTLFASFSQDKIRYLKTNAPSTPEDIIGAFPESELSLLWPAYMLAGQDLLKLLGVGQQESALSLSMGKPGTVAGEAVDIVLGDRSLPRAPGARIRFSLALGRADHLLRQVNFSATVPGPASASGIAAPGVTSTSIETYQDVRPNPALPASAWAFAPPPGAVPVESLAPPQYDPRLRAGARPIEIEARDLGGKKLSLDQYRGKVVLLDFWATWCAPCVAEAPNIIAAYSKFHRRGFEVVGISLDQDRVALQSFIKQNQMPWRQGFDGLGWNSSLPSSYGLHAIPFALLIGRDGRIASMDVRGEALEPAIKAALARR